MPGTNLSGSGSRRTPRHTWTQDQKRCVLLLFTDFKHISLDEAAATFHKVFKHEIDPVGFPNGLPGKSLKSQWFESRQEDNASWAKITRPESKEWEAKRRGEIVAEVRKCLDGEGGNIITPVASRIVSPPSPAASKKRKAEALAESRSDGSTWNQLPSSAAQTRAASRAQAGTSFQPAETNQRVPETALIIRAHRSTAMVVISSTEIRRAQTQVAEIRRRTIAEPSTPQTPLSSRRRMPEGFTRTGHRQPPGMSLFKRPHGPPVWLWPAELERAQKGWIPPAKTEAHPPLAGLLFRFWDADHSRAKMRDDGIVAERYASSNCVPPSPPPVEYLDCNDVLVHLDQQKKETPFVSVSDSLVWCLNKVLKKVKEGKWLDAHVSVIHARALNTNGVFYALPFYRQLQAIWALENKTSRGVSAHEFFVWNKIPASAILRTFAVKDLVQAAASSPNVSRALRLDVLSMAGDFQAVVLPRLQQAKVSITSAVTTGMAEVAMFLGLGQESRFESHRYIVNELVSSYGLVVGHLGERLWQDRAAAYAHAFCRRSEVPVAIKDQQKLKAAFYEGVCLGSTKNFRITKLMPDSPRKVRRTAERIGLSDRGRLVTGECDAAKLYLVAEQLKQKRLLEGRPSERLLRDEVDGGEGEDDARSMFAMGDDGLIV